MPPRRAPAPPAPRRRPARAAPLAALLLAALAVEAAAGPRIAALVEHVVDGDTLIARPLAAGGGLAPRERVRLAGIDCPERDQAPWGARAAQRLRSLVGRGPVDLEVALDSRDRHGRLLAWVWAGGQLAQLVLVRDGFCLTFTAPPTVEDADQLAAALRAARRAGLGIHDPRAPLPEAPWTHRRRTRAPAPGRDAPRKGGEPMRAPALASAALAAAVLAGTAQAADLTAVGRAWQACAERLAAETGRDSRPSAALRRLCQEAAGVWDAQGYGYGRDSNFAGLPDPDAAMTPQAGGPSAGPSD